MLARKTAWIILAALAIATFPHARQLRADEPAAVGSTKAVASSSTTAGLSPDDKSLPPKDAGAAANAGETGRGLAHFATSGEQNVPVPLSADGSKPAAKSSRPQITETEGILHGETANYPRVVFITAKDSPECDKVLARLRSAGGDFENLRAAGWKIGETADNDIQIVDRDLIPELAQKLNIHEYPAVACIGKGKVVRSFKSGCTTPLDAWTFGWLAKGVDERPTAPVLEAAQVETTGHYPLRGNHWSVSGDWNPSKDEVVAHLRSPNHASRILASQHIEEWSLEELRSLHDDLHESEPGYNPYASQGSSSSGGYKSKGEVR
jgi:hypothetical protein